MAKTLEERVADLESRQAAGGADWLGPSDEFEGEIIANGGIAIPAAVNTVGNPPNNRRVRWFRLDGAMVAQDYTNLDQDPNPTVVQRIIKSNSDRQAPRGDFIAAAYDNATGLAGIQAIAEPAGSGSAIRQLRALIDGSAYNIINSSQASDWAQLNNISNPGILWLSTNGAGGGLKIGSDTWIYRGAAQVLTLEGNTGNLGVQMKAAGAGGVPYHEWYRGGTLKWQTGVDSAFAADNFFFWTPAGYKAWISAATGAYTAVSDRRDKRDIERAPKVLDRFVSLPIYDWRHKDEKKRNRGPMARDFYKAFPELRQPTPKVPYRHRSGGRHSVGAIEMLSYSDRLGVLEACVQELTHEIKELKKKVASQ